MPPNARFLPVPRASCSCAKSFFFGGAGLHYQQNGCGLRVFFLFWGMLFLPMRALVLPCSACSALKRPCAPALPTAPKRTPTTATAARVHRMPSALMRHISYFTPAGLALSHVVRCGCTLLLPLSRWSLSRKKCSSVFGCAHIATSHLRSPI
jgi:hypothetical protein